MGCWTSSLVMSTGARVGDRYLVQYAAGHKDPRTTEHYQRRKEQLDDNAVDYIHF